MNIINYVNKLPLSKAVLPDPITWYLPALKAGHKIMRRHEINALFSSYYPSLRFTFHCISFTEANWYTMDS